MNRLASERVEGLETILQSQVAGGSFQRVPEECVPLFHQLQQGLKLHQPQQVVAQSKKHGDTGTPHCADEEPL